MVSILLIILLFTLFSSYIWVRGIDSTLNKDGELDKYFEDDEL